MCKRALGVKAARAARSPRCCAGEQHFAQRDEFGVAEEAAVGPFREFDFGFDFGAEPGVVGHFVGGDAFAPMARLCRREVGEGALFGGEGLEEFEQGAAVGGVEALMGFADEEESGSAAGARPLTAQHDVLHGVPTRRHWERTPTVLCRLSINPSAWLSGQPDSSWHWPGPIRQPDVRWS